MGSLHVLGRLSMGAVGYSQSWDRYHCGLTRCCYCGCTALPCPVQVSSLRETRKKTTRKVPTISDSPRLNWDDIQDMDWEVPAQLGPYPTPRELHSPARVSAGGAQRDSYDDIKGKAKVVDFQDDPADDGTPPAAPDAWGFGTVLSTESDSPLAHAGAKGVTFQTVPGGSWRPPAMPDVDLWDLAGPKGNIGAAPFTIVPDDVGHLCTPATTARAYYEPDSDCNGLGSAAPPESSGAGATPEARSVVDKSVKIFSPPRARATTPDPSDHRYTDTNWTSVKSGAAKEPEDPDLSDAGLSSRRSSQLDRSQRSGRYRSSAAESRNSRYRGMVVL